MTHRAPDMIFRKGVVWTADQQGNVAESIAVRDGRILAVGRDPDIVALADKTTAIVDLRGRMAMPGLIDVHLHVMLGGREALYELRFPGSFGFDEICGVVAQRAKAAPGKWIVGGSWRSDLIAAVSALKTLDQLDRASDDCPVVLTDESHHNCLANRQAMWAAGITRETPDPPNGVIVRDKQSGEPVGLFIEGAKALFAEQLLQALPRTAEREMAAACRALEILNGHGITSFQDAASTTSTIAPLCELDRAGKLTAWMVGSLPYAPFDAEEGHGENLWAQRETFRTPQVFPDFTKFFLDGVPPARTAAFVEPYLPEGDGRAGSHGELYFSTEELARLILRSEDDGYRVKMHCAGDAAVKQALDAIELVRRQRPDRRPAHHIAHASFVLPEDIPRFKKLNAVADLCPIFWFPTPTLDACIQVLGEERARRFWPNRDLLEAGALLAAGSDWPIVPDPNPWLGIEGMVTRRNPTDPELGTLWPEQALDLETVLRIYTINCARAMGISHLTGSLERGKSADFIVLDQDIRSIKPELISKTSVLRTYFRGRCVHGGRRDL